MKAGLLSAALLLSLTPGISLSNVQAEAPQLSDTQIRELICRPEYLWDCETMVSNSWRESNYYPGAVNRDCYPGHYNPATGLPYICAGLLQVMEIHVSDWTLLLDPVYNIEVAYRVYLTSRSNPWARD